MQNFSLLLYLEEISCLKPKEFTELVCILKNFFKEKTCLTPEKNPVITNLERFNEKELKQIIIDYSAFSNEAIHMLLDAKIRNHDWKELRAEIQHNIDEELGLKTKNVPHLEIMRIGYKEDLNIETDFRNITLPTKHFLAKMRRIFKHDNNAYSAGALLAFEGTAIPEFEILDIIVKKYLW